MQESSLGRPHLVCVCGQLPEHPNDVKIKTIAMQRPSLAIDHNAWAVNTPLAAF
jgi:hypothetical protein